MELQPSWLRQPPTLTFGISGVGTTLWLAATGVNMWIGVSKAGYSVAEELPVLLLLVAVPAAAAALARWKLL